MSLYYCSSCADTIPLHKPRINCIDCRFHNVCANCYVLSVYTGQHVRAHTTRVIPKSGKVLPPPLPARHSSTTIPQSQPQGRPEVGRRPVGGPQIQQQTPQYASQPVPLPYSHPTGNPNRMSYIPPQPVPSPATEGTWNQGGPSNRISQNIQLAHQPGPPLVYSQEGYNTALGSRQPLQYIPPPPQGTPPNAVGVHGWDQAGSSHQIQQYTLQPTAPPQQTTPPAIVGTSVGNVEQIPQYESLPTPPPAQTTPPAATEQVYKPHQYAPHVTKGAANENISATTQEAAQVPTQFTSAGQEPNLVQDLPNSNTQKVTNTNPANSQPSQATPLVATAEPPENSKNQGTLSVAGTESIYGTPQPGAPTTSGTPIYNQTHQHANPQTAREEPKYTVPQPERLGTTANVDRQLPRATLPMINPDPLPTTTSWSPIFEGCVPSATGAAFLNTVFDCLDVERKGLITPEQWSAFNDVQGYELHEDPCKCGVYDLIVISIDMHNQGNNSMYHNLGIMARTLQTTNFAQFSKTFLSTTSSRNVSLHQTTI